MKDAHVRRCKAERALTKTLPTIDPGLIAYPTRQERLLNTGDFITCVAVEGNEFIAISNERWRFALYSTRSDGGDETPISEISRLSDEEAMANKNRNPLWTNIPKASSISSGLAFISKNVVACIEPETVGLISTWCARSGINLESITVRGARFGFPICTLTDSEFAVGSFEGHLSFFSHEHGCNLKEAKRIWKAHRSHIMSIKAHKDKIVSASIDCTARVWDTRSKKCLAVLHQNKTLYCVAISDTYIMTCSYFVDKRAPTELRIYNNDDGYRIVNILTAPAFGEVQFLNGSIGVYDDTRSGLVFLDVESGIVVAKLEVGCKFLLDFAFLTDGRVVAVGSGACRGVIVTLPRFLRRLAVPETGKRRFCTLM